MVVNVISTKQKPLQTITALVQYLVTGIINSLFESPASVCVCVVTCESGPK